jgi:hypothetical protein
MITPAPHEIVAREDIEKASLVGMDHAAAGYDVLRFVD